MDPLYLVVGLLVVGPLCVLLGLAVLLRPIPRRVRLSRALPMPLRSRVRTIEQATVGSAMVLRTPTGWEAGLDAIVERESWREDRWWQWRDRVWRHRSRPVDGP